MKRIIVISALLALPSCAPKPPPFNYEAATTEQQQQWLEPIAKEMHRGFKSSLESNGMIYKMSAEPVEIYPGERRIVLAFKYNLDGMQASGDLLAAQNALVEKTCKLYVQSELAPHNIRLIMEVRKTDGSVDFTATNSVDECAQFAAQK